MDNQKFEEITEEFFNQYEKSEESRKELHNKAAAIRKSDIDIHKAIQTDDGCKKIKNEVESSQKIKDFELISF